MFLTKLAIKNLLRHKNRTVITSVIIAFAIFYYLLLDSMIGGMTEMSYQSLIDYEAGHLQLVNQAYWDEEEELPLENLLTLDEQILSEITEVRGYVGSSPELNFQAMANNGVNELPVIGKGIDPNQFGRVFSLEGQYVEGAMFESGDYKAVMGKRLAELLRLGVGDYLTLLVKDKNETFNTIDLEIAGLIHTGDPNVNSNFVYLPLDLAQQSLNVDNQVSKLIVRLDNADLANQVAGEVGAEIKTLDNRLVVYSWDQLEAIAVASAKQAGAQLMLVIIILIAAIAIINTVILAALERMEEIGMMKAMGLETKDVIYTFVLESTGIGLLGGLIGVIWGAIGVWVFSIVGIDFGSMMNFDMGSFGVPVVGKMYGVWKPESFVTVFSFGVIVSLVSSILPAYWAADKDPIKAIYHR